MTLFLQEIKTMQPRLWPFNTTEMLQEY